MENNKQLIIVRHGKSSWKYESIADIDRHLKEKGIHDVYDMAGRLKDQDVFPDVILSSPASRALHTALIFSRTLDYPVNRIHLKEIFYNGSDQDVLEVIRTVPDDADTIMIFGHNPTFTDLANHFLPEELDKLPTAGMAVIEFNTDRWEEIEPDTVSQTWVDYPKKKS
jgi:phosphohistidine phosphatase